MRTVTTTDSFYKLDLVTREQIRGEAFQHGVLFDDIYRIEGTSKHRTYYIYLIRDGHRYLVDGVPATDTIRVRI